MSIPRSPNAQAVIALAERLATNKGKQSWSVDDLLIAILQQAKSKESGAVIDLFSAAKVFFRPVIDALIRGYYADSAQNRKEIEAMYEGDAPIVASGTNERGDGITVTESVVKGFSSAKSHRVTQSVFPVLQETFFQTETGEWIDEYRKIVHPDFNIREWAESYNRPIVYAKKESINLVKSKAVIRLKQA